MYKRNSKVKASQRYEHATGERQACCLFIVTISRIDQPVRQVTKDEGHETETVLAQEDSETCCKRRLQGRLSDAGWVAERTEVPRVEPSIGSMACVCSVVELRKHVDVVFGQVAKLKLLEGSSLSASSVAADTAKEKREQLALLTQMQVVADALFYLNEDIKLWRIPQFEVLTSVSSLITGVIVLKLR